MTNIFDTLVKINALISHNKFKSHNRKSLRFFININPKLTFVKVYVIAFKKN